MEKVEMRDYLKNAAVKSKTYINQLKQEKDELKDLLKNALEQSNTQIYKPKQEINEEIERIKREILSPGQVLTRDKSLKQVEV